MDQRFEGTKYKADGTTEYTLRLAHVQNIIDFIRTLNLYEIDEVQRALTECRNQFLKDEQAHKEKIGV